MRTRARLAVPTLVVPPRSQSAFVLRWLATMVLRVALLLHVQPTPIQLLVQQHPLVVLAMQATMGQMVVHAVRVSPATIVWVVQLNRHVQLVQPLLVVPLLPTSMYVLLMLDIMVILVHLRCVRLSSLLLPVALEPPPLPHAIANLVILVQLVPVALSVLLVLIVWVVQLGLLVLRLLVTPPLPSPPPMLVRVHLRSVFANPAITVLLVRVISVVVLSTVWVVRATWLVLQVVLPPHLVRLPYLVVLAALPATLALDLPVRFVPSVTTV